MPENYDTQRRVAEEYSAKHKLPELLSHLLQLVAYCKPEDPRAFMAEEIRKIRDNKASSLFVDEDFRTMFEMVDVTKRQSISADQLRNTCRNLSLDVGDKIANLPDRVGAEQFTDVLQSALQPKNHWADK